ncbi:MAG: hypothetical protein WD491_09800 [Balneolales bacterium]
MSIETTDTKTETKNISRIDQPSKNTHGWFVRIRRDGNKVSKFFSDGKYGGREEALDKARTYRDENLSKWEKFAKNSNRSMHVGKTSNIGYPGISYCVKTKTRNGEEYKEHVFQVSSSPEKGVHKNKSFYIPKAKNKRDFKKNYEEKLADAIRFRDQEMLKIYGARYVNFKKKREKNGV